MVLLVYLGTDLLAVWGLNLEFGVAGVANLAYIVVVAAGAYTYAVCTLGAFLQQRRLSGVHRRFPAFPRRASGRLGGGRHRGHAHRDHRAQAPAPGLSGGGDAGGVADVVHQRDPPITGLFNGSHRARPGAQLRSPSRLRRSSAGPSSPSWRSAAARAYLVLRRFTNGPIGRTLRAMRDDDTPRRRSARISSRSALDGAGGRRGLRWHERRAAGRLHRRLVAIEPGRMSRPGLLSGRDRGWDAATTAGSALGTLVIAVLLLQGVQFLPQIVVPVRPAGGLRLDVLGGATIAFIWFRPQGMLPERRPRYGRTADPGMSVNTGGFRCSRCTTSTRATAGCAPWTGCRSRQLVPPSPG